MLEASVANELRLKVGVQSGLNKGSLSEGTEVLSGGGLLGPAPFKSLISDSGDKWREAHLIFRWAGIE